MPQNIIFFDTETSGLPHRNPHMLQLAWIITDPQGKELSRTNHYQYLPPEKREEVNASTRFHGIDYDLIQDRGVALQEIINDFEDQLYRYDVRKAIAFDAQFDIDILRIEYRRLREIHQLMLTRKYGWDEEKIAGGLDFQHQGDIPPGIYKEIKQIRAEGLGGATFPFYGTEWDSPQGKIPIEKACAMLRANKYFTEERGEYFAHLGSKWPMLQEAIHFLGLEEAVIYHDALEDVAATVRVWFELDRREQQLREKKEVKATNEENRYRAFLAGLEQGRPKYLSAANVARYMHDPKATDTERERRRKQLDKINLPNPAKRILQEAQEEANKREEEKGQ